MDSKQAQQVGWDLVRCGAARSPLEEDFEVIGLTKDCALEDVKCLSKGFKMEQPIYELQVRGSDHSFQICVGDEEVRYVQETAQAPHKWLV